MGRRQVHLERQCLEPALVDAINAFCREVLVDGGFLDPAVLNQDQVVEARRRIVRATADRWESGEINEPD